MDKETFLNRMASEAIAYAKGEALQLESDNTIEQTTFQDYMEGASEMYDILVQYLNYDN